MHRYAGGRGGEDGSRWSLRSTGRRPRRNPRLVPREQPGNSAGFVGNLRRLDRGPGSARNDNQVFIDLTVRGNPSAVSRFRATSRSGIDRICPTAVTRGTSWDRLSWVGSCRCEAPQNGLISRIGIDPRVAATLAGSHLHVAEPHWPSVHSAPVQTRRNSVVPAMYFLKRGSST